MPKLLDAHSGYEFEDLMVDVFRNLGYENPRVHKQGADGGRAIRMEEVVDGQRRAVIVECKHKETVSCRVVQKLHSAVTTYDYDGPKCGIVVTSGRFTQPAIEYAQKAAVHSLRRSCGRRTNSTTKRIWRRSTKSTRACRCTGTSRKTRLSQRDLYC